MRSSPVFRREGIKFSINANMSLIPLFLGSLSSPVCLLLIWISCIIFFLCCQTPFKVFVFCGFFWMTVFGLTNQFQICSLSCASFFKTLLGLVLQLPLGLYTSLHCAHRWGSTTQINSVLTVQRPGKKAMFYFLYIFLLFHILIC